MHDRSHFVQRPCTVTQSSFSRSHWLFSLFLFVYSLAPLTPPDAPSMFRDVKLKLVGSLHKKIHASGGQVRGAGDES